VPRTSTAYRTAFAVDLAAVGRRRRRRLDTSAAATDTPTRASAPSNVTLASPDERSDSLTAAIVDVRTSAAYITDIYSHLVLVLVFHLA